ncbi:MAG: VWA domain-containing protein [Deltaproteobacteria bacterium]|nr:MAG: VWA domain-containing protein [Deltaproteobacteria bacterium]
MSFAGWGFVQIATFLVVGIAAVTGLYLLRMRRRRIVVPFAALWEQVLRASEARRFSRRFRRLLSWLVQVAILLLLALALADPRPAAWLRPPKTVLFVVDRGASMDAPAEDGRPRIALARDRLAAELAALGPADRAAVVLAGPSAEVAAPLSPAAEVRASLGPLSPAFGPARLDEALDLASALATGTADPSIFVITDGAVDPLSRGALAACVEGPVPCRVHRIPGPPGNLGIAAFAARRRPFDPTRVEVVSRVENHDERPHGVVLEIWAGDVPVGHVEATIPPGAEHRHVFDDLDAPGDVLRATIRAADGKALPGTDLDDIAYAAVPAPRATRVVLVTDGTDLFLEAVLLSLGDAVDVTAIDPRDTDAIDRAGEDADVVVVDVGDEPLPELPADVHLVVFDPWRHDDAAFPIRKGRDVRRPFLTEEDRSHPLLEDVTFVDVNIARGTTFRPSPGDEVLVRTLGEPIVVVRDDGTRRILAIGFDPRQSDLPLRVAFPLFLANAVEVLGSEAPGFVATVPAGVPTLVSLADLGLAGRGVEAVRVQPPRGETYTLPVHDGRVRLRVDEPGIVTLSTQGGSSSGETARVAATAGALGSLGDALADAPWIDAAAPGPPPTPLPVADDPLWLLLLALVAAAGALEWWTYHRRWTV